MTEIPKGSHQDYPPAVQRLRELCDEVHTARHRPTLTFARIALDTDSAELESALASTRAGEIMLQSGESFSISGDPDHYPDLGVFAGEIEPEASSVTAWVWESPPHAWSCQLDTEIWYKGQGGESDYGLSQRVSLAASDHSPIPSLTRALSAGAYAETGYEGHGFNRLPDVSEADGIAVLDIVEPLVRDSLARIMANRRSLQ